jgi:phage gp16-like protein
MTAAARAQRARPARFAPDPHRRTMIAKLHLARKDLALEEEDYRVILERVTGKRSAADLSAAQLDSALKEMARLGWQAKPASGRANNPAANKARAMLISLGLMGVIRNTSEQALNAFARRQTGIERLSWVNQEHVYKLIEALKGIANRNGWNQSTEGLADPVWTLKLRLCEAILARLIAAGIEQPGTALATVAGEILATGGPVMTLTERHLEQLAAALGARLKAGPKS